MPRLHNIKHGDMEMKLVLCAMINGIYPVHFRGEPFEVHTNSVYAYIYYGSKKTPLDHLGNPIGVFYQRPDLLIDDLQKKVLPIIEKGLESSNYYVHELDMPNDEPRPTFIICRKDHKAICESDFKEIEKLLKKAICENNKLTAALTNSIFTQANKSENVAEKNEYKCKLRSHQ